MSKKSNKRRIVTKDVGQAVNTTFSTDSSPSPQINVVPTPATGSNASVMYWPSPQAFYQQGKEMAKKAFHEYLNVLNQYQNIPDDQFDQKMQLAGKMNNLAQSFVQGISIGAESAENIHKRIRTGDQAALIEMEAVKDTLSRMLKTLWVHNKAAASGKWAGLEAKLLESQLVTRLNQSTQLESTNYGIGVLAPEEADTIWVDQEMPSPMEMTQGQMPIEGELPPEEAEALGQPMEEQATGEEEVPVEEMFPEEGAIEENTEELPINEEEIPVNFEDETTGEIPAEETEEIPTETDMGAELPEEEIPVESEGEAMPTEEETPLEEEETVEEEMPEEEMPEEEIEEVDEDGVPLPTGPNGYYTKEDMIKYAQMVIDDILAEDEDEEIEDVNPDESEEEDIEEEEIQEGDGEEVVEDEVPDEEEFVYCIECDREVSPSDVEECDNPNCPFKKDLSAIESEEDIEEEPAEDDIPVDFSEEDTGDDEIPVDFSEEESEEEVEDVPPEEEEVEKEEKHFIMMDHDDHRNHNVKNITIKEFTDVDGDYCLDCGKILSYSFAQKSWTSEDAKRWVNKQLRINKQKNMSAEEIVMKKLDNLPEDVLNEWVEDKRKESVVTKDLSDDVDMTADDLKEIFSGNTLKDVFERAFAPLSKRLKSLEA